MDKPNTERTTHQPRYCNFLACHATEAPKPCPYLANPEYRPNTDSREDRELWEAVKRSLEDHSSLCTAGHANNALDEIMEAALAYTANKQKALLDSLHREIFSDAGVLDIVEIAKLIRDKKESLS